MNEGLLGYIGAVNTDIKVHSKFGQKSQIFNLAYPINYSTHEKNDFLGKKLRQKLAQKVFTMCANASGVKD